MTNVQILEKLDEILTTIEGLRIEIEGFRKHNSSNADHFEAQIRTLVNEVRGLRSQHT